MTSALRTELRATIRLGLPLVAGQVLLFGTNVIDTLLAGHLGPVVLGAVAIGFSVQMIPLMAMQGVMFAVPACVSQLVGGGRRAEVGALFRQAMFLAVAMGLVMLVGLRAVAAPLVSVLGVSPELAPDVVAFLRAVAWQGPGLGVFMACRGLSDGLSMTRPAMWFGALTLLLLLPIGYALMYGVAGLPGLGAVGSGLAAAMVSTIGAFAFALLVWRSTAYHGIGWRLGPRGPDLRAIGGLLALGGPMATSVVLEVSLFSLASFAIARFGAVPVSAHQIALNVAGIAFMVPLGLAGAITVRVGDAVGRGLPARARLAGILGIGLSLGTQSVTCLLMLTLPWTIAAFYSNDPQVQAATVSLLALAGLFQLSDGVQVSANGALRGMKDTRIPVLITLFAYWGVGIPTGLLLAFPAGMAARGMWLGLFAGLTTAALLLTWRFHVRTLAAVQHRVTVGA